MFLAYLLAKNVENVIMSLSKKVIKFLRCTTTYYFEPTNYAWESRVMLMMSGHKLIPSIA